MPGDKALTLFSMTLRNLFRQRVRTALTVLSVGLGVVAIVSFGTLVQGIWSAVETAIKAGGADMMVFQAGAAADMFSTLEEDETRAVLVADPDVEDIAAGLFHVVPVQNQPFVILYGVHLHEFMVDPNQPGTEIRGQPPRAQDEIMLGVILERTLKKTIGDELMVGGEPLKIVGIFETDVVFFNGGILMALPKLQEMIGRQGLVNAFMIKLREGADLRTVADRIETNNPKLVTITNAAEYRKVDQGLEVAKGMVKAVSLLAVIIGSIIVMNTMWMTVYERTREIGVLRALGWSRGRVIIMILIEATGVGLMACIVGSLLGVGLAELTTVLPVASQFNRPVYNLPPFVLAFSVGIVLSLIGAMLPAWRASQISPVEALRYE